MTQRRTVVLHSYPTWLTQTQTWLYNQVRCLPASVENHVACQQTANLEQFRIPNIHAVSDRWPLRWRASRWPSRLRWSVYQSFLTSVARQTEARILHSHFGNVGWLNLPTARRCGLLHVVSFYGLDVHQAPQADPKLKAGYREMFRQAAGVLCEGPHMADSIHRLGCPREKLRVHPLGVDISRIKLKPRTLGAGQPLRVLIAASFREKKGIPYALAAVGRLRGHRDVQVTVIGDSNRTESSEREKQRILKAVDEHGLGEKIRFLGYQPYEVLMREAHQHHVFLSPSVTAADGDCEGGAPVSLIEMSASGMPIVATTHCDIPQVVLHGRTGLLAEERDVDALAEHLRWLVDHPEAWAGMATEGRKHVEQHFDAQARGRALADIYQELLGSAGAERLRAA